MRSKLLLGQNVTPRGPRPVPRRLAVLLCDTCLSLGLGFGFAAGKLGKPAPAFEKTDQNWLVEVTWEPVLPGRFLGVEKVEDADVCKIHVAAEAPYDRQLTSIQAGTAACFTQAFTREPDND